LFALTVWCYSVAFMSEKPSSWVERLGNTLYALAVMVLPLAGVIYLASFLAHQLGQEHLYWAVPAAALVLALLAVVYLRKRLSDQDKSAKAAQLANQEILSLNRAGELFDNAHYDLAVIEGWKALCARLARVLELHGYTPDTNDPQGMIDKARR